VFFLLGEIKYVGIIYLLFSDHPKKRFFLAMALFFAFVTSLQQGMFHNLMVWFVFIFIYVLLVLRPFHPVKLWGIFISVILFFSVVLVRHDFREYVSYGFDGSGFVKLGEVDNGYYDMVVDIDWLNDDGQLDVILKVSNELCGAGAWLDSSVLYGNIADPVTTTPEPATVMLFGTGLAGLVFRRKRS